MKRFIAFLTWTVFGVRWVVLEDRDGDLNLRMVRRGLLNRFTANRFSFGIRNVVLLPHGGIGRGLYVVQWHPYYPSNSGWIS